MKRPAVALLALVALSACAAQERPEGVVERWLFALNQGSAGRPDRYALRNVSDEFFSGWEHHDPGSFDVIEVGHVAGTRSAPDGDVEAVHVPLRVEWTDGTVREGYAEVARSGNGLRVVGWEVDMPLGRGALPSLGGAPVADASFSAWLAALGAALALLVLAEGSMRLVRRGASR
jgi:hypothetical protein